MFEKASRMKLRFPYKGSTSVEDLWDLSVEELDSIFKQLNSKVKTAKEESLLDVRTASDTTTELQIEIIKHIVKVKLDEEADRKSSKERAEKKQKLLSILASKQESELQGKSIEDIQKMINELG